MAPADHLAAAGSSSYSSDTLHVGDGTWDFTKDDFLLPNLVGVDFETMRYNGMGNRFSTIPQYHTLITGHGVLAAITFLGLIPLSVMIARFHTSRSGFAMRYHAYLNIMAVLLSTVVLILGWFAVGPKRSLTNPHHGIGVAIYTLILVQAIGGSFVRHLAGRHSLRLNIHRWSGRLIALLGIVQIPLGLTLYGSPKSLFVLYALWMTFLLLVYFILSHRREGRRGRDEAYVSGGRVERPEKTSGGKLKWLAPLAAGAGIWALMRRRRDRSASRSRRMSRSRAGGSRSRSRSRAEVISSRRGSDSFVEDEKMANSRRRASGGKDGFMNKLLGVGAAAGAGALLSNFISNRRAKNIRDEEYSAVDTDTPSRHGRPGRRLSRVPPSDVSYFTEDYSQSGRTNSPTPGPRRNPSGRGEAAAAGAVAGAAMAGANRPHRNDRPVTPQPSHQRTHSNAQGPVTASDYSSYESPSQRTPPRGSGRGAAAGTGFLGGMGLGWLANRFGRKSEAEEVERRRQEEDYRRSGAHGSRYTGDGYGSPMRRDRRSNATTRPPPRVDIDSDISTSVADAHSIAPVSTLAGPHGASSAASGYPPAAYPPVTPNQRRPQSPRSSVNPIRMPEMPPDSDSDLVMPSEGRRRSESRRRREAAALGAGAVAGAGAAAALGGRGGSRRRSEDSRYASGSAGYAAPPSKPVSVALKVHDDRGGNITLRRLTEQEAAAARERERAAGGGSGAGGGGSSRPTNYNDSASSLSATDSPSTRRYRRDSSVRPAELAAERRSEAQQLPPHASASTLQQPLEAPNPPFAGGRRPKDSAYFSGAAGGGPAGSLAGAGQTATSLASPGSHGTWSGMSPSQPGGRSNYSQAPTQPPEVASSAAAERRRIRRQKRSETGQTPPRVDYQ